MSIRRDTPKARKKRNQMSIRLQVWCWAQGHKHCPACRKRMFFARMEGGRFWRNLDSRNPDLFTLDHIVPFLLGGKDEAENFMPLCCACNGEKGNAHPSDFWAENIRQHGRTDRFWADRIAIACNLYLNKGKSDE